MRVEVVVTCLKV